MTLCVLCTVCVCFVDDVLCVLWMMYCLYSFNDILFVGSGQCVCSLTQCVWFFFRIKREAQQKHVGAVVLERQRVRIVLLSFLLLFFLVGVGR